MKKQRSSKKPAIRKPEKMDPLDSPQWVSESSVKPAAAQDTEADGSPAPCSDCHLDFILPQVTVVQTDKTYSASTNVDSSRGGWEPDKWTITKNRDGATINSATGVVTFGKIGQEVTVTASVKRCPSCRNSFTLRILKLSIYYNGKDVTDKLTEPVYVGEAVPLQAVITPTPHGEADYQWSAAKTIMKDFGVFPSNADPWYGWPIPYQDWDLIEKTVDMHWITDGVKQVIVTAELEYRRLVAATSFRVVRPATKISAKELPIEPAWGKISGVPNAVFMQGQIEFTATPISEPGVLIWVQVLIQHEGVLVYDMAHPIPPIVTNDTGLDGGFPYPYGTGNKAVDLPGAYIQSPPFVSNGFIWKFRMFLLFKPNRPGIYAPLRFMDWFYEGKIVRDGDTIPGHPPKWEIGPIFGHHDDQDTLEYPAWTNFFPPKFP